MDKYDWIWNMTDGKNRWTSCLVVPIEGVFCCKLYTGEFGLSMDKWFWFSNSNGVMAAFTKFYNRSDTWKVNEKTTTWYITNKSESCVNSIAKDDYDYVKFEQPKKFIVLLEDNRIVGFVSNINKIMEFLL